MTQFVGEYGLRVKVPPDKQGIGRKDPRKTKGAEIRGKINILGSQSSAGCKPLSVDAAKESSYPVTCGKKAYADARVHCLRHGIMTFPLSKRTCDLVTTILSPLQAWCLQAWRRPLKPFLLLGERLPQVVSAGINPCVWAVVTAFRQVSLAVIL